MPDCSRTGRSSPPWARISTFPMKNRALPAPKISDSKTSVQCGKLFHWLDQVFKSIHLYFQRQLHQLPQLAFRKPLVGKPQQIRFGQIDQYPALIFSERHGHLRQFQQIFFVKQGYKPNSKFQPATTIARTFAILPTCEQKIFFYPNFTHPPMGCFTLEFLWELRQQ